MMMCCFAFLLLSAFIGGSFAFDQIVLNDDMSTLSNWEAIPTATSDGSAASGAAGSAITSIREFRIPLKLRIRMKQTSPTKDELLIRIFPQDLTVDHTGYAWGPGCFQQNKMCWGTNAEQHFEAASPVDPSTLNVYSTYETSISRNGTIVASIDGTQIAWWEDVKYSSGKLSILGKAAWSVDQVTVWEDHGGAPASPRFSFGNSFAPTVVSFADDNIITSISGSDVTSSKLSVGDIPTTLANAAAGDSMTGVRPFDVIGSDGHRWVSKWRAGTDFTLATPLGAQQKITTLCATGGCSQEQMGPIGMVSGLIADTQVTASSRESGTTAPRLNGTTPWTAAILDTSQYVQIALLTQIRIGMVEIQGNPSADEWVSEFELWYSFDGTTFLPYTELGATLTFRGNTDRDTIVRNVLAVPLRGQYFRLQPTKWNAKISMRFELYTCDLMYFDHDTFEDPNDAWHSRHSNYPPAHDMSTPAFAGAGSMFFSRSYARNFERTEPDRWPREDRSKNWASVAIDIYGFDTNFFPFMCMAYNIPEESTVNMLIYCDTCSSRGWWGVKFNEPPYRTYSPRYRVAADFNVGETIVADGEWHHHCINFDEQLDAQSFVQRPTRRISRVIFHPDRTADGPFWIDEFALTTRRILASELLTSIVVRPPLFVLKFGESDVSLSPDHSIGTAPVTYVKINGFCYLTGVVSDSKGLYTWRDRDTWYQVASLPVECKPVLRTILSVYAADPRGTNRFDLIPPRNKMMRYGKPDQRWVTMSGLVVPTMPGNSFPTTNYRFYSYGGYVNPQWYKQDSVCIFVGMGRRADRYSTRHRLAQLPVDCRIAPGESLYFMSNYNTASNFQFRVFTPTAGPAELWVDYGAGNRYWCPIDGISFSTRSGTTLAPTADWVHYPRARRLSYYVQNGLCYVSGTVSFVGTTRGRVTTLPRDCRPRYREVFPAVTFEWNDATSTHSPGHSRVDVLPNGEVIWISGSSPVYTHLSLDMVKFVTVDTTYDVKPMLTAGGFSESLVQIGVTAFNNSAFSMSSEGPGEFDPEGIPLDNSYALDTINGAGISLSSNQAVVDGGNAVGMEVEGIPFGTRWSLDVMIKTPIASNGGWHSLLASTVKDGDADHHVLFREEDFEVGLYSAVDRSGVLGCGKGFFSAGFKITDPAFIAGWNRLIVVGQNRRQVFYVNGKYMGRTSCQIFTPVVSIGSSIRSPGWGTLAQISLYQRALSFHEIEVLHKAPNLDGRCFVSCVVEGCGTATLSARSLTAEIYDPLVVLDSLMVPRPYSTTFDPLLTEALGDGGIGTAYVTATTDLMLTVEAVGATGCSHSRRVTLPAGSDMFGPSQSLYITPADPTSVVTVTVHGSSGVVRTLPPLQGASYKLENVEDYGHAVRITSSANFSATSFAVLPETGSDQFCFSSGTPLVPVRWFRPSMLIPRSTFKAALDAIKADGGASFAPSSVATPLGIIMPISGIDPSTANSKFRFFDTTGSGITERNATIHDLSGEDPVPVFVVDNPSDLGPPDFRQDYVVTGGMVKLGWKFPEPIPMSELSGFVIEKITDHQGCLVAGTCVPEILNSNATLEPGVTPTWWQSFGGLTMSTAHQFRIATITKNKVGAFGLRLTLTTKLPTKPSAPRSPRAFKSTGGAIYLRWDLPVDFGGVPLAGFQLFASGVPNFLSSSPQILWGKAVSLKPFTDYIVTVAALNEVSWCVGSGDISMNVTYSTGPVSDPTRLLAAPTVISSGGGSASLEWPQPGDLGGLPLAGFQVGQHLAGWAGEGLSPALWLFFEVPDGEDAPFMNREGQNLNLTTDTSPPVLISDMSEAQIAKSITLRDGRLSRATWDSTAVARPLVGIRLHADNPFTPFSEVSISLSLMHASLANSWVKNERGSFLSQLGSVTISMWVRQYSGAGKVSLIEEQSPCASKASAMLSVSSAGQEFSICEASGSFATVSSSETLLNWAHLVGTYHSNCLALYIDGRFADKTCDAQFAQDLSGDSATFSIYADRSNDVGFADVRLYPAGLSSSQVSALHSGSRISWFARPSLSGVVQGLHPDTSYKFAVSPLTSQLRPNSALCLVGRSTSTMIASWPDPWSTWGTSTGTTVELYVETAAPNLDGKVLWTIEGAAGSVSLEWRSGNVILVRSTVSGGADFATTSSFPTGRFVHVSFTIENGATGVLYLDASEVARGSVGAQALNWTKLTVGGNYLAATVDDLRVFSTNRSVGEIRRKMGSRLSTSDPHLAAYLSFDTTDADSSANAIVLRGQDTELCKVDRGFAPFSPYVSARTTSMTAPGTPSAPVLSSATGGALVVAWDTEIDYGGTQLEFWELLLSQGSTSWTQRASRAQLPLENSDFSSVLKDGALVTIPNPSTYFYFGSKIGGRSGLALPVFVPGWFGDENSLAGLRSLPVGFTSASGPHALFVEVGAMWQNLPVVALPNAVYVVEATVQNSYDIQLYAGESMVAVGRREQYITSFTIELAVDFDTARSPSLVGQQLKLKLSAVDSCPGDVLACSTYHAVSVTVLPRHIVLVGGLQPSTAYTVQVKAGSSFGDSSLSEQAILSTVNVSLPSEPWRLLPTNNSFRLLVFTWDPPRDSGGLSIINYHAEIDSGSGFVNVSEGVSRSLTRTGEDATPKMVYKVRVRAQNQLGWGPFSATLVVKSGGTCPPFYWGDICEKLWLCGRTDDKAPSFCNRFANNMILVSPSGQDSNDGAYDGMGNVMRPVQTLNAALGAASDGTIIVLMATTYSGASNCDQTITKDILIVGVPGQEQSATLSCRGQRTALHVSAGKTVELVDLLIEGGASGSGTGGAVLADSGAAVHLNFTRLTGQAQNGGALYLDGATLVGTQSVIFSSTASGKGGGIYAAPGSQLTLSDFEIRDSRASQGGGMFAAGASIYHSGLSVSENVAAVGGGISLTGSTLLPASVVASLPSSISQNRVELYSRAPNNFVLDSSFAGTAVALGGCGGNVFMTGSSSVYSLLISSGVAMYGGGVFCLQGSVGTVLSNVTVSSNLATADVGGRGGGLYVHGGTAAVSESLVAMNSAASSNQTSLSSIGGGIAADAQAALSLTTTIVKNNFALSGGGAVHLKHADATLSSTNVLSNSARQGGGIQASSGSQVFHAELLVSGNCATLGGGFRLQDSVVSPLTPGSRSVISGNQATDFSSCPTWAGSSTPPAASAPVGGGLHITGSFSASGLTISSNSAPSGGALSSFAAVGTISSCKVHGCGPLGCGSGQQFGGGFFVDGAASAFSVIKCEFSNHAASFGGAILVSRGALSLADSIFVENVATSDGGAILASSLSTVSARNVTFQANAAFGMGGAVASVNSHVNLSRCVFRSSTAARGGAVSLSSSGVMQSEAYDCEFSSNTANELGGSIYTLGARLSLTSCRFESSAGTNFGGAIAASGGVLSAVDSYFTSLAVSDSGGALFLSHSTRLLLTSCTIVDCKANIGGAIAASSAAIANVVASNISKCTAIANGGAVHIHAAQLECLGVRMVANSVSASSGNGGAAYATGAANMTFMDSYFEANFARSGGAIGGEGSSISLSSSRLVKNRAEHDGGALTCRMGSSLQTDSVRFAENLAKVGGALRLENCDANISAVQFQRNTANGSSTLGGLGGALAISGASSVHLYSSSLYQNQAIGYASLTHQASVSAGACGGGLILLKNQNTTTTVNLENVHLSWNSASGTGGMGGGVCALSGSVSLHDSALVTNKAHSGGAIYSEGAGTWVMLDTRSVVSGNNAATGGGLFVDSGSTTTVGGSSELAYNYATTHGGAVAVSGGTCIVGPAFLSHNRAVQAGGAASVRLGGVIRGEFQASNNSAAHGGALDIDSAGAYLSHTLFSDNHAMNHGGAISLSRDAVANLSHTTILRSTSPTGGCVAVAESALHLEACSVSHCQAASVGAAIFAVSKASVVVSHSNITENFAEMGAAVYLADQATADFLGSRLSSNTAIYDGAALYLLRAAAKFSQCIVHYNRVNASGGAIYLDTGTSLECDGTIFSANEASRGGGVFLGRNSKVSLLGGSMSANKAQQSGGALAAADNHDTFTVRSVGFSQNSAAKRGGAVDLKDAHAVVEGCSFTSNAATQRGGAINLRGAATIQVSQGSTFSLNTAKFGGGVAASGNSEVRFHSSAADQNMALSGNGGALYASHQVNLSISHSTFSGNSANGGGDGGAIYLAQQSAAVVQSTSFERNQASRGGAMFSTHTVCRQLDQLTLLPATGPGLHCASLSDLTFSNNRANMGGAVFWSFAPSDPPLTCDNCVYAGNTFYDISTDPTSVKVGWFPTSSGEVAIQSGVPIIGVDGNGSSVQPYLNLVDFYGSVSLMDSQTTCSLKPLGEPAAVVQSDTAYSRRGVVKFDGLSVKGDISVDYTFAFRCTLAGRDSSLADVPVSLRIGPCHPGWALDSSDDCKECPEDTYSPGGKACLPCPEGGICRKSVLRAGLRVSIGVALPGTAPGYWLHAAPVDLLSDKQHCDWDITQCKPGYHIGPKGDCVQLRNHDPLRIFNCLPPHKHFYRCPMDELSCNGSLAFPHSFSVCSTGYAGPLCGLCSDGYYRASDNQCQICSNLGTAETAKALYAVFSVIGCSILGFFVYLYLREDGGSGLFKCCNRQKSSPKVVPGGTTNKHEHTAAGDYDKTIWFRPEKFKILLSFVQIFAQFKNNYGIAWPTEAAAYLRAFAGFNLDILAIAAVECIMDSNFYFGLVFSAGFPMVIGIVLAGIFAGGKSSYERRLQSMPRSCIKCGAPVTELQTRAEFAKLQHASTKKQFQESGVTEISDKDVTSIIREKRLALRASSVVHRRCVKIEAKLNAAKKAEVARNNRGIWRRRCLTRISFLRFNSKAFKLYFWMLLLAYPALSVRVMRLFKCEMVGDKTILSRDFSVMCYDARWTTYAVIAIACIVIYIIGIPGLFFCLLWNSRNIGVKWTWRICQRNANKRNRLLTDAEADASINNEFWSNPHNLNEEKAAVTRYLRRQNFRSHRVYNKLGFIYYAYNESAWWYEMVELMRKLSLNGLIVLISPGEASQVLMGMLLCFTFLVTVLLVRPYNAFTDHLLAVLTHVHLFLTLSLGLVITLEIPFLGRTSYPDPAVRLRTELDICQYMMIVTHFCLLLFGLASVLYEKFWSSEVRELRMRRQEKDNMRKRARGAIGRGMAKAMQDNSNDDMALGLLTAAMAKPAGRSKAAAPFGLGTTALRPATAVAPATTQPGDLEL